MKSRVPQSRQLRVARIALSLLMLLTGGAALFFGVFGNGAWEMRVTLIVAAAILLWLGGPE